MGVGVSGASLKSRQNRISKASDVSVLDRDHCLLLAEKGWELTERETRERDVLRQLEVCLDDLVQHQSEAIAIEGDVLFNAGFDT